MSNRLLPVDLIAWRQALDADALEFFEERAAILEYEAGLPRAEAEARAYALTVAYQQRQGIQEARHVPD